MYEGNIDDYYGGKLFCLGSNSSGGRKSGKPRATRGFFPEDSNQNTGKEKQSSTVVDPTFWNKKPAARSEPRDEAPSDQEDVEVSAGAESAAAGRTGAGAASAMDPVVSASSSSGSSRVSHELQLPAVAIHPEVSDPAVSASESYYRDAFAQPFGTIGTLASIPSSPKYSGSSTGGASTSTLDILPESTSTNAVVLTGIGRVLNKYVSDWK